jgi:hypothetical protein
MPEFIATEQTVQPGASVIFGAASAPCNRGLVFHRPNSGLFRLASPRTMGYSHCGCCGMPEADYLVSFNGNIAVPTGGTVEEITLSVAEEGESDAGSLMRFTPAAVEEYGNVGTDIIVSIPYICGCGSVAIRNTSAQPITLSNGVLTVAFDRVR